MQAGAFLFQGNDELFHKLCQPKCLQCSIAEDEVHSRLISGRFLLFFTVSGVIMSSPPPCGRDVGSWLSVHTFGSSS